MNEEERRTCQRWIAFWEATRATAKRLGPCSQSVEDRAVYRLVLRMIGRRMRAWKLKLGVSS